MHMKVVDIIFALVCGRLVGFLVGDFLYESGINVGVWGTIVLWIAFPFFALFCLWVAHLVGRKFLFIFQGAKFLLIGAGATVIDLKIFEILAVLLGLIIPLSTIISKTISFLFSTLIKFWGNKYWTFGKHEKDDITAEAIQFFAITIIGLVIDVSFFFFCANILGPQFGTPAIIWLKISVIIAALAAALWNFVGYKFFVFKK